MQTRLILVEGIPGSGKTGTAGWIYQWLRGRNVDVELSDELRPDHPVIDRALMKTSRKPGFADRCVARWREFGAKAGMTATPQVHILEATLFQCSVRFLLEHQHDASDVERYFVQTEAAIAALQPLIVYLEAASPRTYLEEQIVERKGEETISKIAAYTETTAIAKQNGWTGLAGMFEFYLHYRTVCDQLIEGSRFDVLRLDTPNGDWASVHARLESWLDSRSSPIPT